MYLLNLFIVIVAEWIHFHWQRSTAAELPDLSCTRNKNIQLCLADTSTATDGPGDVNSSHQPAGLNSADDSAAQRNTFNLFYFLRGLIAQLIARINKYIEKITCQMNYYVLFLCRYDGRHTRSLRVKTLLLSLSHLQHKSVIVLNICRLYRNHPVDKK